MPLPVITTQTPAEAPYRQGLHIVLQTRTRVPWPAAQADATEYADGYRAYLMDGAELIASAAVVSPDRDQDEYAECSVAEITPWARALAYRHQARTAQRRSSALRATLEQLEETVHPGGWADEVARRHPDVAAAAQAAGTDVLREATELLGAASAEAAERTAAALDALPALDTLPALGEEWTLAADPLHTKTPCSRVCASMVLSEWARRRDAVERTRHAVVTWCAPRTTQTEVAERTGLARTTIKRILTPA